MFVNLFVHWPPSLFHLSSIVDITVYRTRIRIISNYRFGRQRSSGKQLCLSKWCHAGSWRFLTDSAIPSTMILTKCRLACVITRGKERITLVTRVYIGWIRGQTMIPKDHTCRTQLANSLTFTFTFPSCFQHASAINTFVLHFYAIRLIDK